jgi:drug/metabolite transporter (DMT)-like permease
VALVCGLALAWSPGELGPSKNLGMGLLAITGTAICWGASTTFGRGAMLEIDFASGAAVRYVIGTVATFLIVLRQGAGAERMHWEALTQWSVARDMGELLLVAAITPTFIYFAGLARTRASVATFAEMGQTFASLLITWGILGEALSPRQLLAGVVLLTAVYFINRSVDSPTPTVEAQIATE